MTTSGISQIPLQKYVQAFDIDKLTLTRSTLQINHLVKIIQTFKYFPKLTLQKGLSKMPQKIHTKRIQYLYFTTTPAQSIQAKAFYRGCFYHGPPKTSLNISTQNAKILRDPQHYPIMDLNNTILNYKTIQKIQVENNNAASVI